MSEGQGSGPRRRPSGPAPDPAAAGALLISAILLCAAVGLGLGALVGLAAPLAIAGGFIGVGVGFSLVYRRFKNL